MMLNGGELDGVRAVQPADRRQIHRAADARPTSRFCAASAGTSIRRYSGNRGELFPIGSYGHTGFTGTSIWIDPSTQDLRDPAGQQRASRRCGPSLTPLRAKVATIAAAAVGITARGVTLTGYNETLTGAGVRREVARNGATQHRPRRAGGARSSSRWPGKRIGLITNQTGVDRLGRRNVDLMQQAGIDVAALFSPEHGFAGQGRPRREFRTPPTPPPASRSSASTAPPCGPRPKCCAASTRWSSTSRTWACASTPTRPPWRTPWKRRPRRAFRSTCSTGPTPSPACAWKGRCWMPPTFLRRLSGRRCRCATA